MHVTQRRRLQALALGILALVPLGVALVVSNPLGSGLWWAAVVVVAASWWWLRSRIGGIADTSSELLDEREVAIRNRAAWWGQALSLALLAAIAVLIQVVARPPHDAHLWLVRIGGVALSSAFLAMIAPTVMVTWMTADSAVFDDEDEL